MRYYFIRHGENPANLERMLSHKVVDLSLTELGKQQAQGAARWLADKQIQHIYSSPLKRAIETAEIIGQQLGLSHNMIEELRELNVGVYDGRNDQEAWDVHNKMWFAWMEGDLTAMMEGGEDGHALSRRLRYSVELIEQALGAVNAHVAVVAHGGLFFFGLAQLCENLSLTEVIKKPLVNTAVCIVEKRGEAYYCVEWGIDPNG